MTERDWLVEPSIARGALTLLSGAHALDVALAFAASITRGHGLPGPNGWARDLCVQGGAIVSGVALEQLRNADAEMDNVHGLELVDADGNARAFALGDVAALYAKVEAHRVALVLLVDIELDVLPMLADFAERLNLALLVLSSDARRVPAEIPHSVLEVVETRSETYAVVHRSSRIGPLGPALSFSTWSGPSWDGLVDPAAIEALPRVAQASPVLLTQMDEQHWGSMSNSGPRAEPGTGSGPFVPFVTPPCASAEPEGFVSSGGFVGATDLDAESMFLLEQLAHGPMRARDVQRRGAEQGFAVRTLRRRAEALGIQRRKSGMRGGWLWVPPARAAQA